MRIEAPFTERHTFTGPNTAISCEVAWDDGKGGYVARSEHGWSGFSRDTADAAALNCFSGWMLGNESRFDPTQPEQEEETK